MYKSIQAFSEFAETYSEFDRTVYRMWNNLQQNEKTILNGYILSFFDDNFANIKKIKKILKRSKIPYQKNNKNKGEEFIQMSTDTLLCLLLIYSKKHVKSCIMKLPVIIHDYENHITETRIKLLGQSFQ